MPTDEQLQDLLDACKEYVHTPRSRPKTAKPSRFADLDTATLKPEDQYQQEMAAYRTSQEEMENSQEYKDYMQRKQDLRGKMKLEEE